jgi:pimeloyl-ACP methyl ester carboxylesterase
VELVGLDSSVGASFQQPSKRHLEIHLDRVWLQGELTIPTEAKGMVLCAYDESSSRLSAKHQWIASNLNQAGLATCLFDLLSVEEEQEDRIHSCYRFNIALLGQRLIEITDWIDHYLACSLPLGYFSANTAAAAAPVAAVARPDLVKAMVSLHGRADMAVHALHEVEIPMLFIVGGLDHVVVELNRLAYRQLPKHRKKELLVVANANHLFEDSDNLDQVAQHTVQWFTRYLTHETLN